MTLEFRTGIELRAIGAQKLAGYVATFGTVAQIRSMGRSFNECIAVGAFSRTLADRHDVPALVDHDSSKLLARTGSGSLRLSEDSRGLAFELDLPDTTLGRDMQALAERRDLAGMSFGFQVASGGEAWPSSDMRELRAVDLIEISIAQCWPAYAGTTVAVRSQTSSRRPEEVSAIARRRLLEML